MKSYLHQLRLGISKWTGEEQKTSLELDEYGIFPLGSMVYSLKMRHDAFAMGHLAVDVQLQCVRCLRALPCTIEIDNVSVQLKLIAYQRIIDLTSVIREDTMRALPSYPRYTSTSCLAGSDIHSRNVSGLSSSSSLGILKNLTMEDN